MDFYFPDRNGSAIFLLKNEISGPIKKAVMIVPMPTTSRICPMEKKGYLLFFFFLYQCNRIIG